MSTGRPDGCRRWQTGQRGSQRTRASAIARRMVMKESAKWRSGRAADRVKGTFAFRRGGKSAGWFRADEGIAPQGDRDVVVPPWKRATLEVVEPELALEVL